MIQFMFGFLAGMVFAVILLFAVEWLLWTPELPPEDSDNE